MKDRRRPCAVVLLSGGLDSAVALALARRDGFNTYALSVRYGQRHEIELEAARKVAAALGTTEHRILNVGLGSFGGSALTDAAIEVPHSGEIGSTIPPTYVPARNTVLLSLALAWAEVLGATNIYIGVNSVDYSGYPDCRPRFIDAFQALANVATRAATETGRRVSIQAPLLYLTKPEIIALGTSLGVDFSMTISCYDPAGATACGRCDACVLRAAAFATLRRPDPALV